MIIRNGKIFNENGQFVDADILLENGKIAKVAPVGTLEGEGIDASGKYVTPGFVDIHTHGCAGADFCDTVDGSTKYIEDMSKYYGSQGVTTFLGTTMAFSEDILENILKTLILKIQLKI